MISLFAREPRPDLLVNGDGGSTTGWTPTANLTLSSVDGALRATAGAGFVAATPEFVYQVVGTLIGARYRLTATRKATSTAPSATYYVTNGALPSGGGGSFLNAGVTTAPVTVDFTATGLQTTVALRSAADWAIGQYADWDDMTFVRIA